MKFKKTLYPYNEVDESDLIISTFSNLRHDDPIEDLRSEVGHLAELLQAIFDTLSEQQKEDVASKFCMELEES